MSDTILDEVREILQKSPTTSFGQGYVIGLVAELEATQGVLSRVQEARADDIARAEKAESDKAALEEDLEATEKNLKESSGFIEELLSGLKHRFPVQYANLEGDEYGDDAFSSHDLFEHVIDPAVNAAQKAEANVAQLISAAPDLFEALKKAIDALERADDSFGVPGLHGIINEADAAIRKAEGE